MSTPRIRSARRMLWRAPVCGAVEATTATSVPGRGDAPPEAAGRPSRVRLLVLAAAGDHLLAAPLLEDLLAAGARLGHRVLGRQRAGGGLGEHVGDHVGVENLALGRVGEARVAEIRGPRQRL